MKKKYSFRCPETLGKLDLVIKEEKDDEVIEGELVSEKGKRYPVHQGVAHLMYPEILPEEEAVSLKWYDDNADVYDANLPLTFKTFKVDEFKTREEMIDTLDIKPDFKVLETGSGTGRDSELIAKRLGKKGELHLQDISLKIFEKSFDKMKKYDVPVTYSVSNAIYLPYPDKYFDVYYHFGGFNTFSDKKRAFEEISRVTKVGGKVIVGDESMPVWLRDTEFGKVLMNSNPHYKYHLPLEYMHVSARDVMVKWIFGGVFYYISYTVGEGEPYADIDFEIPGARGGTHRTRYYGHLEGVTDEAIKLAKIAREKKGISMHKWLDDAIKNTAKKDLED